MRSFLGFQRGTEEEEEEVVEVVGDAGVTKGGGKKGAGDGVGIREGNRIEFS